MPSPGSRVHNFVDVNGSRADHCRPSLLRLIIIDGLASCPEGAAIRLPSSSFSLSETDKFTTTLSELVTRAPLFMVMLPCGGVMSDGMVVVVGPGIVVVTGVVVVAGAVVEVVGVAVVVVVLGGKLLVVEVTGGL